MNVTLWLGHQKCEGITAYFMFMTPVGPACTKNISKAEKAAVRSPGYLYRIGFYEPVEVDNG